MKKIAFALIFITFAGVQGSFAIENVGVYRCNDHEFNLTKQTRTWYSAPGGPRTFPIDTHKLNEHLIILTGVSPRGPYKLGYLTENSDLKVTWYDFQEEVWCTKLK